MNEIEKLYENAGIKPIKSGYCDWDCDCPYPDIICGDECPYWKYEDEANYPPFTAEKQLELIKWLGIRDEFNFYQNKITKDWIFYDHEKDATYYNFELGLASWVNYLWQDLTEEERKQIKEILE